jgi:hypothetical protein
LLSERLGVVLFIVGIVVILRLGYPWVWMGLALVIAAAIMLGMADAQKRND